MKTSTVKRGSLSILLLLLLQTTPIKAMNAEMVFALPEAKAGVPYEFAIRIEGGKAPFKWTIAEGDLPPGIELEQSGRLRGTPVAPRPQPYDFTLKGTDSSKSPQAYTQRFTLTVTPLSESDERRLNEQAREQHQAEQDLVKEFIHTYITVMDPKSVSDIFGRRIAKRYVAFQVTISNDNKDYQFLIQDLGMNLSDVVDLQDQQGQQAAASLAGLRGYKPSSNTINMLRGVSEKGQTYDWRNLSMRLLEGTGTLAASLGTGGVISVGHAYAPSVAVFNGPFANAFRHVFPDLTVNQVNRLNDSAYQANTLVPRQGAKVMVAFVDMAMLMDKDLQKRFYKNPLSIVEKKIDFRKARAEVRGMLITDVLDQPPLISAVVINEDQRAHFTDKPATIEGTIIGRNLTGAGIQIENDGMEIKLKGAPESNRLTFTLTSKEPILPDYRLNFVVVRKDDVAKQALPVSYTIPVPTLDKINPETLKRGETSKEVLLTGKDFLKGLFKVTGCDGAITIKDSAWQSSTEIKLQVDVSADAAKGPCELRVENGKDYASHAKPLTIEKAKEKEKEQAN